MATRIPFTLDGQFVARVAAREFTRRDTGEVVKVDQKLQFLVQAGVRDDAGMQLVEVGGSVLDRVTPPFDHSKLSPGDRVELAGEAVIQDRGSSADSFYAISHARPVGADVKPVRNAA